MMSLAMVVIASMIGVKGRAAGSSSCFKSILGSRTLNGLAIVILAIIFDRSLNNLAVGFKRIEVQVLMAKNPNKNLYKIFSDNTKVSWTL